MMTREQIAKLLESRRHDREDYVRQWREANTQLTNVRLTLDERASINREITDLNRTILSIDNEIVRLENQLEDMEEE
jgi:hypothetical protein